MRLGSKFNSQVYQPNLASVFYFDIVVLVVVFFMTLLSSYTERSIRFNIAITILFFVKAILGTRYRLVRQYRALRLLLVQRFLFDIFLIIPAVGYFRLYSNCSPFNLAIVIFVVAISELITLIRNCWYLGRKSTIETIESLQATGAHVNLQGFTQKPLSIWYFNKKLKAYVL